MAGEEPESRWDMYEHLKVLWQTVALVNALMVSACITSLNSDVSKLDVGEQRCFGCMWSACLMANIAALMYSCVGLGLLLRLRTNADIDREFSWDYQRWAAYLLTMSPSACTIVGTLMFLATCISTSYYKFGKRAGAVAACIGLLTVGFGIFVLVSAV